MDTINDRCQMIIINYLSLKDQLQLYEATKDEPTNRLNRNLLYTWQHQTSFYLDWFLVIPEKQLNDFLTIISPTVHELIIDRVTMDNLKHWKCYQFPEIKSLSYTIYIAKEANLIIQLMAEIFPGINSIEPFGKFDLIHLTNWNNICKLSLDNWLPSLQTDSTIKLPINKLQMVEMLSLYRHCFTEENLKMLMCLPRLKTFAVAYPNNEYFRCIIKSMRAKDIWKVSFEHVTQVLIYNLSFMNNLREVSLLDTKLKISYKQLYESLTYLPLLERLDVVDSQIWQIEMMLWQVVDLCPSLKILNISINKIYDTFFDQKRDYMYEVLDKRTTPLNLFYNDIWDYEHMFLLLFKHPNLNISYRPLETFDRTCVFYFNPLVKSST